MRRGEIFATKNTKGTKEEISFFVFFAPFVVKCIVSLFSMFFVVE